MQQVKSAVPVSSLEVLSARYVMNNHAKTIVILLKLIGKSHYILLVGIGNGKRAKTMRFSNLFLSISLDLLGQVFSFDKIFTLDLILNCIPGHRSYFTVKSCY